jgi:hypothetical protein
MFGQPERTSGEEPANAQERARAVRTVPRSRRPAGAVLCTLVVALAGLVEIADPAAAAGSAMSVQSGAWSDPGTWGGRAPQPGDAVTVANEVTLDTDAKVEGLRIEAGARLDFASGRSATLESTRNLLVDGHLGMHPSSPEVVHVIRFVGIDESAFEGGGGEPLDADVGLWVGHAGMLDAAGTAKTSWTRTRSGPQAGARTLTLESPPVGWQAGDELAIAPTLPPTEGDASFDGFDEVKVERVTGAEVTLDRPLEHGHPTVDEQWNPEVMNLTRNVRIEGTPDARTHVMVMSHHPQSIGYVQIRHVGPQQGEGDRGVDGEPADDSGPGVLGRYGLHFHQAGDGAKGSNVTGTVVRDAGNHAYVAHASHGITFRDTVAYNIASDAYWWDGSTDTRDEAPETDRTLYDHCLAARIVDEDMIRLSGFNLMQGVGNTVRNSTAVGVLGGIDSSGFHWPESSGRHGHGVWKFDGNLAHNNSASGIFVWQNDGLEHRISNFTGYHNGEYGIDHGAYVNGFEYASSTLYGNGEAAINAKATTWVTEEDGTVAQLRFDGLVMDGAGISEHLVVSNHHNANGAERPTIFTRAQLGGATGAAISMTPDENGNPYAYYFVDAKIPDNGFEVRDGQDASFIQVQSGNSAYRITQGEQRSDAEAAEVDVPEVPVGAAPLAATPKPGDVAVGGSGHAGHGKPNEDALVGAAPAAHDHASHPHGGEGIGGLTLPGGEPLDAFHATGGVVILVALFAAYRLGQLRTRYHGDRNPPR